MNEQNQALTQGMAEDNTPNCTNTSCCPPTEPKNPVIRHTPKVGRNDPCVCGSGVKYKKCCGKIA